MSELPPTIPMTVALLGLGHMGAPMCARLLDAGVEVRGYDADPARAAGVTGLVAAASAGEAVRGADVVVMMLPDSDVVEAVHTDIADALDDGAVLVDMGSSDPVRTRALAEVVAASGRHLVDAPVSGGVAGATAGTLAIMVGGPDDVVAPLVPLLEVLGRVSHVGPAGAGHALKALNNLMSAAHLMASSEALLAGRAFGLDVETMLGVINASSGRSGSTEVKWPRFVVPESYDSGFAAHLMLKDVRTAVALMRSLDLPRELSDEVERTWAAALADLSPGADHTEIVRALEGRS